jgi:hypothetical protein
MSHNTYIESLRQRYDSNRAIVQQITGTSDIDLYLLMMGCFYEYLEMQAPKGYLADYLTHDLVWKWWVNEWNLRDHVRIIPLLKSERPNNALEKYAYWHRKGFFNYSFPFEFLKIR